jgi:signal peptidase I
MSASARASRPRAIGCFISLVLLLFIAAIAALITLRALNLIRPFYVPMAAMAPAVSTGDHVMVESFTYSKRKPKRGDVVVFNMDKPVQALEQGIYVMRIVGEPGDTVSLTEDGLVINDKPVVMQNLAGKIHYASLQEAVYLSPGHESVLVPAGNYFLMGDNTNASADSRFWGFLPAGNIIGKVSFCFWPSTRMGMVK